MLLKIEKNNTHCYTWLRGTLAGVFFGVHIRAGGEEKAERARDSAEQKAQVAQAQAMRLAASLPPAEAQRIMNIHK